MWFGVRCPCAGRVWSKMVFKVSSKPGHSVKSSHAYTYAIGSILNASFSRFFCKYFFALCPAFMKPFYLQASFLKKICCQYRECQLFILVFHLHFFNSFVLSSASMYCRIPFNISWPDRASLER